MMMSSTHFVPGKWCVSLGRCNNSLYTKRSLKCVFEVCYISLNQIDLSKNTFLLRLPLEWWQIGCSLSLHMFKASVIYITQTHSLYRMHDPYISPVVVLLHVKGLPVCMLFISLHVYKWLYEYTVVLAWTWLEHVEWDNSFSLVCMQ